MAHSEKRMMHKDRQEHSHDKEMARIESAKKSFGPMDGGGKSPVPPAAPQGGTQSGDGY